MVLVEGKSERIEIRTTPHVKALLRRAATSSRCDVLAQSPVIPIIGGLVQEAPVAPVMLIMSKRFGGMGGVVG